MTAPDLTAATPLGKKTMATLRQAVETTGRPSTQAVTEALLMTEQQTKRQHQTIPIAALLGTWRLQFTAPKKPTYKAGQLVGKGFYVPKVATATLAFSPDADRPDGLTIQNQLQVGALRLRFIGPAKLLAKKNLLAFDFVRLQLFLGKLRILNLSLNSSTSPETFAQTPVGKLPFFSFFAAEPHYLAARGRGGGLALWVKAGEA
jgi:hypothetical protein